MFEVLQFLGKVPSYFDDWINLLGVLATFLAIVVALFGKEFINWLNRIDIDVLNKPLIFFEPEILSMYHAHNFFKVYLKVKNKNGKKLVKNAKIRLIRISEKNKDDIYIYELNKEAQFKWHTLEDDILKESFLDSQLFYFGYLTEISGTWKFMPFIFTKETYLGFNVNQNTAKIYEIDIQSDNYFSKKKIYFQVYFNGKVNYDIREMYKNLQITKVSNIDDFKTPVTYNDDK